MQEFAHRTRHEYLLARSSLMKQLQIGSRSHDITYETWSNIVWGMKELAPQGFLKTLGILDSVSENPSDKNFIVSKKLKVDFLKVRAVLRLQCFMIDVIIKYKIKEYRTQMKEEK